MVVVNVSFDNDDDDDDDDNDDYGFFSATLRASIICAYVTQGACQRSAGLSEEVQILDRRRKETVRLNEYTDLTTGFWNSYSFKTVFQSH